jgi:hypothetical protein
MRSVAASIAVVLVLWTSGTSASSQFSPQSATAPTLFRITGTLTAPDGAPRLGAVTLVASIYADSQDATPLWTEQQVVTLDAAGRYAIYVGATLPDGVPKELFLAGAGRWLGIAVQSETEQPRIMLVTVPYALKAREADTLAGKTANDFVLTTQLSDSVKSVIGSGIRPGGIGPLAVTTNQLAKFTAGNGTVADSIVTESVAGAGNIGVGTTSPGYRLDVVPASAGDGLRLTGGTSGWPAVFHFWPNGTASTSRNWAIVGDGTQFGSIEFQVSSVNQGNPYSAGSTKLLIDRTGQVGVGTTSPSFKLDVAPASAGDGLRLTGGTGNWPAVFHFWPNSPNSASRNWAMVADGTAFGSLEFRVSDAAQGNPYSAGAAKMTIDSSGNVTIAGNINAKYQDVAEWVETPSPLEPGTVVIVDPAAPNRVIAASTAYDTRVAGAVSRQPGLILGEKSGTDEMIAQSGRVRIKVDASYGAIKIGDLLVTSPTPGHAMLSQPIMIGGQAFHRPGTLLGKALEALPNGKGEILVLLTLQ